MIRFHDRTEAGRRLAAELQGQPALRRGIEAFVARQLVGHHHARHGRLVQAAFEVAEDRVGLLERLLHAAKRHCGVFDAHQVHVEHALPLVAHEVVAAVRGFYGR